MIPFLPIRGYGFVFGRTVGPIPTVRNAGFVAEDDHTFWSTGNLRDQPTRQIPLTGEQWDPVRPLQ